MIPLSISTDQVHKVLCMGRPLDPTRPGLTKARAEVAGQVSTQLHHVPSIMDHGTHSRICHLIHDVRCARQRAYPWCSVYGTSLAFDDELV